MEQTLQQQQAVFVEAMRIFNDRQEVRGDLWAEFSAEQQLRSVEEKIARIGAGFRMMKSLEASTKIDQYSRVEAAVIDDAYDAINILGFLIRRMTGKVPHVPRPQPE